MHKWIEQIDGPKEMRRIVIMVVTIGLDTAGLDTVALGMIGLDTIVWQWIRVVVGLLDMIDLDTIGLAIQVAA